MSTNNGRHWRPCSSNHSHCFDLEMATSIPAQQKKAVSNVSDEVTGCPRELFLALTKLAWGDEGNFGPTNLTNSQGALGMYGELTISKSAEKLLRENWRYQSCEAGLHRWRPKDPNIGGITTQRAKHTGTPNGSRWFGDPPAVRLQFASSAGVDYFRITGMESSSTGFKYNILQFHQNTYSNSPPNAWSRFK
jgi:hypothetical protein